MKIFRFRQVIPQLYNVIVRRRIEFEFELIPYISEGFLSERRPIFSGSD